jgi:hypothetical protein
VIPEKPVTTIEVDVKKLEGKINVLFGTDKKKAELFIHQLNDFYKEMPSTEREHLHLDINK